MTWTRIDVSAPGGKKSVMHDDLEEIRQRLYNGETMASIGRDYGVTREAVRLFVEKNIPPESRARKCRQCGLDISGDGCYSKFMHESCAAERRNLLKRTWHQFFSQREWLTEPMKKAVSEYENRGYNVVWTPVQCDFTFMVNGKRVKVIGSNVYYGDRFVWQLYRENVSPSEVDHRDACDVFHLVGIDGDDVYHIIKPAEWFNGSRTKSMCLPQYSKHGPHPSTIELLGGWEHIEG